MAESAFWSLMGWAMGISLRKPPKKRFEFFSNFRMTFPIRNSNVFIWRCARLEGQRLLSWVSTQPERRWALQAWAILRRRSRGRGPSEEYLRPMESLAKEY